MAAPTSIDVDTVAEITDAVANAGDGTVINVAPGTYTFTSGTTDTDFSVGKTALIIRKGLILRGAAGNPSQTIFKVSNNTFVSDSKTDSVDNHDTKLRLIMLEHSDAKVENLTLFGGYVAGVYYYGGAAFIDYDGGTVSNCAMTACACYDNQSGGAATGQYGGLITHCWITNNHSLVASNDGSGGNALIFQRGVLRNSLVANNRAYCNVSKTLNTGGVAVNGNGVVENCTIANNKGQHTGGIRQFTNTAVIRNCQVQGNSSLSDPVRNQYCATDATGAKKFVSCASTDVITGGTNCKGGIASEPLPVVNEQTGDWRPAYGSAAIGNGLVQDWMTGSKDLDGNARIGKDGAVDIGCYQYQPAAVNGSFSLSAADGTIPATVVFTAIVASEQGAITSYVWDFGDGSEPVTTTEATTAHVYSQLGSYTPTLKAEMNGKFYPISSTLTFKAGPKVLYVSNAAENPDEAFPYGSWETATTNVMTAVEAAVSGSRIVLCKGVHTNSYAVAVKKNIIIEGETSDPAETVVYRLTAATGTADKLDRTLELGSAGASVRNLTLKGGLIYQATTRFGANVYIEGLGGTITNCVITGGQIKGGSPNGSTGSAIAQFGGLVTHCIISNNYSKLASNDNGTGGTIIHLDAGRVEFCLVTGNAIDDSALQVSSSTYAKNFSRIVAVKNGTVASCSVVSNDVARGWTVSRTNDSGAQPRFVNCLIANNRTKNALEGHETAKVFRQTTGFDTHAALDHCTGDAEYGAADPTKYLYDDALSFKEKGANWWQPSVASKSARAAKITPEMVGARYLDGASVPSRKAAVGCYSPYGGTGLLLLVR